MAIQAGSFETILLAELRLGLPPVFCWRLYEVEDDWAFILKLHSLFEGTLAKLIAEIRDLFKVAGWFRELYGVVNMLCGTSLMEKAESIKKAWRERYQTSKAN